MRQTILNEQPFQVLTTAFSIGPSETGYDLQISADGVNFSTLFSVPADTTRMITNVARGSTYRCLGNEGEIVVNWVRDCSDGEGGGGGTGPQGPMGPAGPQGPQGPAGSGETGDVHLLKSSLDIPENAEVGDVFSIYTSGTPAQYGSAWTDTNETTINLYDVQAVRVRVVQDGYFDFGFDDADWHDGMHQYVINNGTELFTTDQSDRVEVVSSTELKFIAPAWYPTKHNGKTMHVKLDNGYLYVWSDDINELHLNDIAQNGLGGTIETGEVVPEVPSVIEAYQAVEGVVYLVKVDFPNGVINGDHWDSNDMTITINEWPSAATMVVNIEWYGSRYYFEVADSQNQLITIYDDNDEKVLVVVEGDSGNINLGQEYSYTFSGGVFTIVGGSLCYWENIVNITDAGIDKRRLMYADEADYQKILPKGANDQDLIAWSEYSHEWGVQRAGGVFIDQYRNYGNYNNGQEAIVRKDYWDLNWQPVIISSDVLNIVKISQSDYDTLVQNDEVSATTLYLIVENNNNQGS